MTDVVSTSIRLLSYSDYDEGRWIMDSLLVGDRSLFLLDLRAASDDCAGPDGKEGGSDAGSSDDVELETETESESN